MELLSINLRVGEEYKIKLEGLGSAGYEWNFTEERLEGVVKISREHQTTPSASTQMQSYNIDELFIITASGEGEGKLIFTQQRQWEKDKKPLKEIIYEIKVMKLP